MRPVGWEEEKEITLETAMTCRFLFLLISLVLCIGGSSCKPRKPEWKLYKDPKGLFSVSLPAEPYDAVRVVDQRNTIAATFDGVEFSITIKKEDGVAFEKAELEDMLSEVKGAIRSSTALRFHEVMDVSTFDFGSTYGHKVALVDPMGMIEHSYSFRGSSV